ncbi:phage tail protein [Hoeflea alexandrii]|uniref:Phage tail collar domain-containing protein n=1 Tax=Hoeflea alexandrii TaxID=288436 RepID=A0ABT1CV72_9HYPH|nr:tail fiber protein [Hoeflea alexandrii]MCO6410109.1 hypothetical protein [Hoeflea alexandrii]MCY0153083.1 tail fiber protein [Hoeflea alexandrii]
MTDELQIKDLPSALAALATHIIAAQTAAGVTSGVTLEQVSDLVIARLTASAPELLDTWLELVAQIEDNEDALATLVASVASKADAATTTAALAARVQHFTSGVALPGSDIGPIWHEDYAALMTWQTFDANSASYTGYASVDVGMPVFDGHSSPRPGYIKRNGASLSKTAYAPLWNWALHHGRVGTWAAGAFIFGDNGDGTFKLPDNRGEFERAWDDSRGVDSGRGFGSWQNWAVGAHSHGVPALNLSGSAFPSTTSGGSSITLDSTPSLSNPTGEARSRNVALLACIKY